MNERQKLSVFGADINQCISQAFTVQGTYCHFLWMFTGVVKQAIFAKISSIFIEVLKENWNWQLKKSRLSVTQADEAKKYLNNCME